MVGTSVFECEFVLRCVAVVLATAGGITPLSLYAAAPLTVSPSGLTFVSQTILRYPVPYQTLEISSPTGSFTAAASTTSGGNWLVLGATSGAIPGGLQVSVDNLPRVAGTYYGSVALATGGLSQNVPVTLTITDGPVAQAYFSSQGGVAGTVLFASQGTVVTPASQVVTLYTSDASPITFVNIATLPSWIYASIGPSFNQLTIGPLLSGLGSGVYTGYIPVQVNNATNSISNRVSIPVVFAATGASSGPLTISPQELLFQRSASGGPPSSLTLSVSAVTATSFGLSAFDDWVHVAYSGGLVTPQSLTISIAKGRYTDPNTFPPGNYNGEIDLISGSVTQKVPVILTVLGGPPIGMVAADEASLSFSGVAGGQAKTFAINITSGGSQVSYTVSVQGGGTWLKSDTTTKQTPSEVTISADPSGLAAGTYQGTVTITSANTISIPVTFTVEPPMASTPTNIYYFPHLAFGGGFQTTLTYINYSPQALNCQTSFYSDSGGALQVPIGGGSVSGRFDTLAAGGSVHVQTQAASAASLITGWAQAQCAGPVKASLLYRAYSGGVAVGEASINASSSAGTEFVTFAEDHTGVAYANPSTAPATVTVTVLDSGGVFVGSTSFVLQPNAHGAQNIGPLLGLNSFTGSVQITSTAPIVSLSLNAEAYPVFSSLPPGDLLPSTPLAPGR